MLLSSRSLRFLDDCLNHLCHPPLLNTAYANDNQRVQQFRLSVCLSVHLSRADIVFTVDQSIK